MTLAFSVADLSRLIMLQFGDMPTKTNVARVTPEINATTPSTTYAEDGALQQPPKRPNPRNGGTDEVRGWWVRELDWASLFASPFILSCRSCCIAMHRPTNVAALHSGYLPKYGIVLY
ncbi:Sensory neuron membrane protein [Dirofilaria immitis]